MSSGGDDGTTFDDYANAIERTYNAKYSVELYTNYKEQDKDGNAPLYAFVYREFTVLPLYVDSTLYEARFAENKIEVSRVPIGQIQIRCMPSGGPLEVAAVEIEEPFRGRGLCTPFLEAAVRNFLRILAARIPDADSSTFEIDIDSLYFEKAASCYENAMARNGYVWRNPVRKDSSLTQYQMHFERGYLSPLRPNSLLV